MARKLNLKEIRQTRESEQASLMARLARETTEPKPLEVGDPGDEARSRMAKDLTSTLLTQTHQHLERVEAALHRLDQGIYGICAICGNTIGDERLHVLPYATTCIGCQHEQEKRKW